MELWPTLGYATLCLIGGIALVIADLFLVSLGVLSVLGIAAMITGCWLAFQINIIVGLIFFVCSAIVGYFAWVWGLKQLGKTKLVLQGEITDDAGYHHYSTSRGIEPGSQGIMDTDAMPTGRARFAGGVADVQVLSGHAERGQTIVVDHIDGPTIFVNCSEPAESAQHQET